MLAKDTMAEAIWILSKELWVWDKGCPFLANNDHYVEHFPLLQPVVIWPYRFCGSHYTCSGTNLSMSLTQSAGLVLKMLSEIRFLAGHSCWGCIISRVNVSPFFSTSQKLWYSNYWYVLSATVKCWNWLNSKKKQKNPELPGSSGPKESYVFNVRINLVI